MIYRLERLLATTLVLVVSTGIALKNAFANDQSKAIESAAAHGEQPMETIEPKDLLLEHLGDQENEHFENRALPKPVCGG